VTTLALLVEQIETAHPFLAGHSRRVARMAEAIGRHIGLAGQALDDLIVAAICTTWGGPPAPRSSCQARAP